MTCDRSKSDAGRSLILVLLSFGVFLSILFTRNSKYTVDGVESGFETVECLT